MKRPRSRIGQSAWAACSCVRLVLEQRVVMNSGSLRQGEPIGEIAGQAVAVGGAGEVGERECKPGRAGLVVGQLGLLQEAGDGAVGLEFELRIAGQHDPDADVGAYRDGLVEFKPHAGQGDVVDMAGPRGAGPAGVGVENSQPGDGVHRGQGQAGGDAAILDGLRACVSVERIGQGQAVRHGSSVEKGGYRDSIGWFRGRLSGAFGGDLRGVPITFRMAERLRTLLVGTVRSVGQLVHLLEVAQPPVEVVGAVLPEGGEAEAGLRGHAALPVAVVGRLDGLLAAVQATQAEQVLLSLPLALKQAIGAAAGTLDRAGVRWRFLPTLDDQLAGRTTSRVTGGLPTVVGVSPGTFTCGALDPATLLDRRPGGLDETSLRGCLEGKTVLVTGAGGSIGSELCRMVCRYSPARLVMVERGENVLFEIDRELKRVFAEVPREAVLHDVTRREATAELLDRVRPDVVFHAAAHKHVPMMEVHPAEAVENNFYGTRHVADAAAAANVGRFVMISTDKAVNPSSVMGATKRLAELYVQSLNTRGGTVFSTVRFGNVLGSASSVLTIWAEQLSRGGPLTVTHPEMTRYFMTIREAAGLVLQAGALSKGGEVFLLDMGEPIRVLDLAERFIRRHGFEPGRDVDVQVTGIRPGEKLFEELAYHSEGMRPTSHQAIRIWDALPPSIAGMNQIATTFDRLRDGGPEVVRRRPWAGVSASTIDHALRASLPEMVQAAAG